jgi:type I restriction enzyme S subunit
MREGWTETTLGDVAEWFSGGTPKAGRPEFYENGTIPWVVIADMMKTEIFDTASKITPAGLAEIGGRLAPKDSVLISMYATVGRPGFAHIPVATNQAIAWSIPDKKMIGPRFLLLVAHSLESEISSMGRGATQRNINRAMLKEFSFNLPPLVEQKRIVDVVSAVDAYIDALQQQADSARTARNAVLHELLSAGGDDWAETNLGEVADVVMGRQLSPSKRMGTRPRPYLRAANIGSWGISLDDVLEMDFTEIEENHFANRIGDVLMVEGGNEKSVGCPALVTEREVGLCIQNTIIRCRVKDSFHLSPEFLFHFLRYSFWAGKFGELCAGTTIRHLGQKRAVVFPLVLPPLDKQVEIVEIVSSMDDVIQAMEQAVSDAKYLRSGLLSDLLSGEHEIPASYDVFVGAA